MAQSAMLFAGSSHPELAREVARALDMPLGEVLIGTFPDGEIGVQILENVRGKDVFVLQSPARQPNHFLMELLILVDALKRASARTIVAVIPYYAYARQDRKEKGRVPITAKLVADLLEKAGVTRVLTMDLHTDQIQGFFNIPVDHLYARRLFVKALKELKLKNAVVVSPDVGSNKMARKFADDHSHFAHLSDGADRRWDLNIGKSFRLRDIQLAHIHSKFLGDVFGQARDFQSAHYLADKAALFYAHAVGYAGQLDRHIDCNRLLVGEQSEIDMQHVIACDVILDIFDNRLVLLIAFIQFENSRRQEAGLHIAKDRQHFLFFDVNGSSRCVIAV
jgi:phosphoribosylpyrophosphate synthetase